MKLSKSNVRERYYIVYYYAEVNDECVDMEQEVKAFSIKKAVDAFFRVVKNCKRIYAINEKTHNSHDRF